MSGPTSLMPAPRWALSVSLLPAAPEAPTMKAPRAATATTAMVAVRQPAWRRTARVLGEVKTPLPIELGRAGARRRLRISMFRYLARNVKIAQTSADCSRGQLRGAGVGRNCQPVRRVSRDLFRRLVVHHDRPDDVRVRAEEPSESGRGAIA